MPCEVMPSRSAIRDSQSRKSRFLRLRASASTIRFWVKLLSGCSTVHKSLAHENSSEAIQVGFLRFSGTMLSRSCWNSRAVASKLKVQ